MERREFRRDLVHCDLPNENRRDARVRRRGVAEFLETDLLRLRGIRGQEEDEAVTALDRLLDLPPPSFSVGDIFPVDPGISINSKCPVEETSVVSVFARIRNKDAGPPRPSGRLGSAD